MDYFSWWPARGRKMCAAKGLRSGLWFASLSAARRRHISFGPAAHRPEGLGVKRRPEIRLLFSRTADVSRANASALGIWQIAAIRSPLFFLKDSKNPSGNRASAFALLIGVNESDGAAAFFAETHGRRSLRPTAQRPESGRASDNPSS
jgi:hypothetical protein